MLHEVELFLLGTVFGIILAMFFDVLRAFRRNMAHPGWAVSLEDFGFWLVTAGTLFYLVEVFNKGVLRFYVFFGWGAGIGVYSLVITRVLFPLFLLFFKTIAGILSRFRKLFEKCKKFVKKMLILPLKKLWERIKIIRNNI